MAEYTKWQWQEPGTAWKGVCTYHITLTVPSRQPLLGTLVIPQNDPSQARVERTALGNAIIDELYVMCKHYPDIRIFQFCLMPDHLHAVIRVTRVMDTSIRRVLKTWFGYEATDDFIWEVCTLCEQEGWNELPPPSLYPRKHREFLRAVVAKKTGISFYRINLKALDAAYSIAFPKSTPINVKKKKRV